MSGKEQQSKILVMKFGGTSVGSVEALTQAADIVLDHAPDWEGMVLVVSAMSGVTNTLISGTDAAVAGDDKTCDKIMNDLRKRHIDTLKQLPLSEGEFKEAETDIKQLCDDLETYYLGVRTLSEVTARGRDMIESYGERMNARIFSALLRAKGGKSQAIEATRLIVTDDHFQSASPIMEATQEKVQEVLPPLFSENILPVVTGFIAATQDGQLTTLGRGGSDYTASILGACLNAAEVWTWTDVDGVMTADPRVVKNARVIPTISYSEVSEMAYFGAKVLHPKTIRPIIERGIPLWVKNTFNPDFPGTRITKNGTDMSGKIAAVTAIKDLSMVTVEGRGMLGVPGIAARTFSAVAKQGASVLMISQSSSEQSICFVIPSEKAANVVGALNSELSQEIYRRDIDTVWELDGVVIVTVIGAGLRTAPKVAGRVFSAVGRADVNIIAIAQGSSEYSISLVVSADQAEKAVQQIHQEVVLNGG